MNSFRLGKKPDFISSIIDSVTEVALIIGQEKTRIEIATVRPDQLQASIPPTKLAQHQLGSVAILNVGGMHNDGQNQAQGVDDNVPLAIVDLLARVIAMRPPFSVVFTLWLSTIAAEGDFFRPAETRTLSRRAS